jgi:hypothetical protein
MNVTVIAPYKVVHEGTAYRPGESVDVPAKLAEEWIDRGWVEKPKATKTTAAKK